MNDTHYIHNTPSIICPSDRQLLPPGKIHSRKLSAVGALALLSVFCFTSCDRAERDSTKDIESPSAEDNKKSEDELLQAQREEELRNEEKARIEEARRNEEHQAQREEVRRQAKGEKIERLETMDGKIYEKVTINQVSPVGLSILHDAGSARIPFEVLPLDLQKRFMFDQDEKKVALRREQAHQNAHDNAFILSSPATASSSQGMAKSEQKKKVMMALASKEARIETLNDEIRRTRDNLQIEENKKLRRNGYYYNSYGYRRYYGDRTIGGISRAPIVRQELAQKEEELATLKRQVAMLRVELESTSP